MKNKKNRLITIIISAIVAIYTVGFKMHWKGGRV